MARIRTVKPQFWASEQVMECSPIARLLFIGLWNFCDDAGNHVDSPKTIKAEIFPGDDIGSSDVRRLLDELSSNGLIVYYSHENKGFLHVTGWHHQKIDKPTVVHPAFSTENSQPTRRDLDDSSPPEGKGREGKGKEKEREKTAGLFPGDPPAPTEPPAPKAAKVAVEIDTWLESLGDADTIPETDPVFAYASGIGLPREMLELAWFVFETQMRERHKRQKDWRAHFRNAVRANWFKLWWVNAEGQYLLTTTGQQAMRELQASDQAEAA